MAYLRKTPGSPFWVACFRDAEGVQRNKSTKHRNRGKAQEVANELERLARHPYPTMSVVLKAGRELLERLGGDTGKETIKEAFENFLKKKVSKSEGTQERYRQVVAEFLEFLGKRAGRKLEALTGGEIEDFKSLQLKKGLAGKSVNLKLKLIRSVLGDYAKRGRIDRNPGYEVALAEENAGGREDFTPSQITALLRACERFKKEKEGRGKDWRGLILVCYYTGCRLSDAANLRAGDVHLDGEPGPFLEYVERKKKHNPKVRKTLHTDLSDYLLSMSLGDDPNVFLFPRLAGRGTGGANGLSREFVALMDEAGIQRRVIREGTKDGGRRIYNLSEHSLRHSTASQLAEAGIPEDVRMAVVGHEDRKVHRGYTHARGRAAAAIQTLPSVVPRKVVGSAKG